MKRGLMIALVSVMMLMFVACGDTKTQDTVTGTGNNVETQSQNQSTVTVTETAEDTQTVTSTVTQQAQEVPTIALGQTVTTKSCEFTLNRVTLSYDVKPDAPPSYYSHYPASTGQVYIYLNATVKNTQKQSLECDEIYSVEADYNNGYKYTGFNIVTDSDGDFTYANIRSVEPLQSMGVHCLIDCPEEVETSSNKLSLTITFKDGTKYNYIIR